ncbi:hypothetical protein U0070_021689, partial [Myodes glareolus]
ACAAIPVDGDASYEHQQHFVWPEIHNTGLGHRELAVLPPRDLAIRDDSLRSQEGPAVRARSSQLVPSVGIQSNRVWAMSSSEYSGEMKTSVPDEPLLHLPHGFFYLSAKLLNKTCCLNGGTCILGSFCACPPFFFGRNCERDVRKEHCGSVLHGTWLPKKCSLCRCWLGQLHCFPQTFLPGCGKKQLYRSSPVQSYGHVMDQNPPASRTPGRAASVPTTFMLAGICLLREVKKMLLYRRRVVTALLSSDVILQGHKATNPGRHWHRVT